MTIIHADQALLPGGWAQNVLLEIAPDGLIGRVTSGKNGDRESAVTQRAGILLPSPVNAHSHGFQRAMAGLTEQRGHDPNDTFWTWRQLMFRFLDRLTPDHVEAIAAFVQMEMLEAGYATNVEFHYLHHQPGGAPYGNLAEMSERIIAATTLTGMGLTLLPVCYQYGGCDKRELGPGQIRFGNDLDQFSNLLADAEKAMRNLPADCTIGVAPHSLRAISPESLPALVQLSNGRPIHMHLAEQVAEVEEVRANWGQRPVEWLLENADVNADWCLIHCTQMQAHETIALAKSGAIAGLCPITESSLGDGIFDGVRWLNDAGRIAIGSDSNIRISLSEELRTLDHSQRLRDHSRAALAKPEKSTARRLFDEVLAGGAQAAGRNTGRIAKGALADLVTLDDQAVDLHGRAGDTLLDCFVFAGDDRMVKDVWSAGRHVVQSGAHIKRPAILERYRTVVGELGEVF
jgi:formimidoylglutamate deiminase